jgi:hypothetical protein
MTAGRARRLDVHGRDRSEHLFVPASGGVEAYATKLETLVKQSGGGSQSSDIGADCSSARGPNVADAIVRAGKARTIACRS